MMKELESLIKRLTRVTPSVDKIVDLVNPDGIPTRSLDTINKIKTVKLTSDGISTTSLYTINKIKNS